MNYENKNCILFGLCIDKNEQIVPMGSLYDSIEYFLNIYDTNKDVQLIFHLVPRGTYTNIEKLYAKLKHKIPQYLTEINNIIFAKYYVPDLSFRFNISIIPLRELFFKNKLNNILTIDLYTPYAFRKFVARANEILIIPELTGEKHFYQSKTNKVTYYTEMPFCYSDVDYKLKMDFERLKPIFEFKNKLYINYPKNNIKHSWVQNELKQFNKPLLNKENQFFHDLHKHFNEYAYFQSDNWFDTHPRLFHECKFYNKPYHYFNPKNVKDGAYYRYYMSLEEQIKDRQLTKNDIIVRRMCE